MKSPLCVELYCGSFGWSQGWLDIGGRAVGFDIEHEAWHGPVPDGADLVIQDVRTLHGRQFRDASLILASPPCQEFSWRSMPWTLARQSPPPHLGIALFGECFRIQREASEAAGRLIPMVVENVKGAQRWVGRARWRHGSYYLWGDVPALMPVVAGDATKRPGHDWSRFARTGEVSPHWRMNGEGESAIKVGGSWFGVTHGRVQPQRGPHSRSSSGSIARRAASAAIARIPSALSRHVAECYWPSEMERAS